MKNLMSMTDFVLEQRKIYSGDFEDLADLYFRYAKFLKKPLELWMFVPCDEYGNVLISIEAKEQYFRNCYDSGWWNQFIDYKVLYHHAKERCLFEGFEINQTNNINGDLFLSGNFEKIVFSAWFHKGKIDKINDEQTIKDLVKYNLQLTQTAIKQLGL